MNQNNTSVKIFVLQIFTAVNVYPLTQTMERILGF